jgi:proline iminopeptidase
VYLHGGPGSKSKPKYLKNFDLEKYQVVMFDQRGCGKSTPLGSISTNTTEKLMDDMERLRLQVGIESWFVSGGSWGSTLALAYAEKFPSRVKGLLLSAIFLADAFSFEWSFTKSDGVAQLFTDVWDERVTKLKSYNTNPSNTSKILLELLENSDKERQKEITAIVSNWEGNLLSSSSDIEYMRAEDATDEDIASVIIFLHYESNNCFLVENQLLNEIDKIAQIPMVIVHGRHDILCPFKGAWDLHKVTTNFLQTARLQKSTFLNRFFDLFESLVERLSVLKLAQQN